MANPNETHHKILSFRDVIAGWHFGEGVAPDNKIIEMALKINKAMSDAGFPETDAFLGAAGEIQVNAYENRIYIETVIDIDNSIEFIYERDNTVQLYQDNMSLANAIAKIEFWGKKWDILESFIKTTSIINEIDLQALPFHYQPMAAYQLSRANALKQAGGEIASISGTSTPTLPESPQSFLSSTQIFSRITAST